MAIHDWKLRYFIVKKTIQEGEEIWNFNTSIIIFSVQNFLLHTIALVGVPSSSWWKTSTTSYLVFSTSTKNAFYSWHIVLPTLFKTWYLYVDETKVKLIGYILTISCNSTISRKDMHFHMEEALLWSMLFDHNGITHDVVGKN